MQSSLQHWKNESKKEMGIVVSMGRAVGDP
jgi:hypothetical protein